MKCPKCGEEMKQGFLYSSKDGALSFSEEVPGVFTNAKKAKGFIPITKLTAGGRAHVNACVCEKCKVVMATYE